MIAGLPLVFAQPLVLLGLLSLPVLWWLLRLIPPRPRRVDFPPTRMLFDIAPKEETPSRTPWWLTLLRLLLAALVILAAAGPQWNPSLATSGGAAPLAVLIDDGWTAASTWDARLRAADDLVVQAENDNRGVALVPLSESARDVSIGTAGAARVRLRQLKPKPHALLRAEALPMIERFVSGSPDIEFVWLSDGIDLGQGKEFIEGLNRTLDPRRLSVIDGGLPPAHALAAAENAAGALTVKVCAPKTAARKPVRCARSISKACRSARPAMPSARRNWKPKPSSNCRWKSATTSPGSRSRRSVPLERCNCSTNAGGGAPSA